MPRKASKKAGKASSKSKITTTPWKDVAGKSLKAKDWIGVDEYQMLEFKGNRFECADKASVCVTACVCVSVLLYF